MSAILTSEAEMFAMCDNYEGNTMILFSDKSIALRYISHRFDAGIRGVVAMVEDTRTDSGLCVIWRDPVPAKDVLDRQANCRWLLEEALAGRVDKPTPGEVGELWTGGFPNAQ